MVYNVWNVKHCVADGVVPAPTQARGATEEREVAAPEAWVAAVDDANIADITNALGVMALIGLYPDYYFDCSNVITKQHDSL